jgi:nucleoredoxin
MLAEMYDHLKDVRPTHGLEIVFVSSDRDPNSFQQYFGTMPWQAIPFDSLQMVKKSLNMT